MIIISDNPLSAVNNNTVCAHVSPSFSEYKNSNFPQFQLKYTPFDLQFLIFELKTYPFLLGTNYSLRTISTLHHLELTTALVKVANFTLKTTYSNFKLLIPLFKLPTPLFKLPTLFFTRILKKHVFTTYGYEVPIQTLHRPQGSQV